MICNLCGKELDMFEEVTTSHVDIPFFYGSKYDGEHLKLSLCATCYDQIADNLISACKVKPEFENY